MQNTPFAGLHEALLDIAAYMDRPQGDHRQGGDRARPRAVRDPGSGRTPRADRVGGDYTTVSQQVGRLASLGLTARQAATDRRVRAARTTAAGEAMSRAIDAARERLARRALASWSDEDVARLSRVMQRFARSLQGGGGDASGAE